MNEKELRELDAWIAEHVLEYNSICHCGDYMRHHGDHHMAVEMETAETPHPTTNLSDAMMVLEKCAEGGVLNGDFKLPVSMFRRGDKQWVVSHNLEDAEPEDASRAIVVEANTLPLAICLFAKQLFSK